MNSATNGDYNFRLSYKFGTEFEIKLYHVTTYQMPLDLQPPSSLLSTQLKVGVSKACSMNPLVDVDILYSLSSNQ